MSESLQPPHPGSRPPADRDLVVLFTRALRQLGEAGHPVAANRLAGKAWWAIKDTDPTGARRIDGVMHYLAKLPEETAPDGSIRTQDP